MCSPFPPRDRCSEARSGLLSLLSCLVLRQPQSPATRGSDWPALSQAKRRAVLLCEYEAFGQIAGPAHMSDPSQCAEVEAGPAFLGPRPLVLQGDGERETPHLVRA